MKESISKYFTDPITNFTVCEGSSNKVGYAEFETISPKRIKVNTFSYHPVESFLGGAYMQRHLGKQIQEIPQVYAIPTEFRRNQPKYVSEYVYGRTASNIESLTDRHTLYGLIAEFGKLLAQIHNKSVNLDTIYDTLPLGEVLYSITDDTFKQSRFRTESDASEWREYIYELSRDRYQNSPTPSERFKYHTELYEYIEQNIDCIPKTPSNPVLNNLDYRLANVAYTYHKNIPQIQSVFDWDRVCYGDWLFGLVIGEFFLTNTVTDELTRKQIIQTFRNAYSQARDKAIDTRIKTQAYNVYTALMYLQQYRSYRYWFDNSTQDEVVELMENRVYNLLQT